MRQAGIDLPRGELGVAIGGVAYDSRLVKPGDLFVARPGQRADGRAFIDEAIRAGAAAVVCEGPAPVLKVPCAVVPDSRVALARLSAAWYGEPSRSIGLVGVTGTDGKTTTTHLIAAILNAAGVKTGLISTVAIDHGRGHEVNRTSQTTPEAPVIQQRLAQMRDSGLQVAALEVSSHALVTERVHGCAFDCAVFTNLDPEHLDFHRTVRAYRAAKARLFAMLNEPSPKLWGHLAVVNADDRSSRAMRSVCSAPVIQFGLGAEAEVRGEILSESLDGTEFWLRTPDGIETIETRLLGRFNVYNWLGAFAAARHFGASMSDVRRAARQFEGVPGRLEPLPGNYPFRVFVDFAHTPQALDVTLGLLRQHARGQVITLFGQAGGRDLTNRGRMAQSVARHSDLAVVTSDDPYDETPETIVDGLSAGLEAAGWRERERFWKIVDRVVAIQFALELARPGDVVLLAGRGPEDFTTIGNRRIPLKDAEVARAAMSRVTANDG